MSEADDDKKIAELEAKLEKRKSDSAKAERTQYAIDLEARLALEEEHGAIAGVKVPRFKVGIPTSAFLRTPTGVEYKRYIDMIGKAVDKKNMVSVRAASELLAKACWVYPSTDEAKAAMVEAFPGLLTPLSAAAAALAEGKGEEEGKA